MGSISGMLGSMSRKCHCWDNSVAESFFGSLKMERVFDSTYRTREEARRYIYDYIEMFYNTKKRRHSYLGYLSPKDFEKMVALRKQPKKNVHFYLTTSSAGSHDKLDICILVSGTTGSADYRKKA